MRTHPIRAFMLIVFLLTIAGGTWAGWQAWHLSRDLGDVVDDAANLRSAVEAGDEEEINESLSQLQTHSKAAAARTSSATWSVLTYVPWIGDDARGVAVASRVVSDLSNNGLEDLVRGSRELSGITPVNGVIPISEVEALRQPVAEAGRELRNAEADLAAQEATGFVERLRIPYRDLSAQVSDAAAAMSAADAALELMPSILGRDRERAYLLVVQNNAEVRATGGLPGAVSLVETDRGAVRMTKQTTGTSFGERATPVLPLTNGERQLYGPQLGTYFLDANFTPDFPRTADLMGARWTELNDGASLDGVFSIDPVALSYVLSATGPVQVDGRTIDSDNAVDELLHRVYLRYPNPPDQDDFFREVARAVFSRVVDGVNSPQDLIVALARGVDERRVYAHLFGAGQETLAGRTIAGEINPSKDIDAAKVDLALIDRTGGKMSYFLRTDARLDATYCVDAIQGLVGSASLKSVAPSTVINLPDYVTGGGAFGTPPGDQAITVHLFAPRGGEYAYVAVNSVVQRIAPVMLNGRPVVALNVTLSPGEIVDIDWGMRTGRGQIGDIDFNMTPGVESAPSVGGVNSACEQEN